MRDFLLRIKNNEILALRVLSALGVPLLMVVVSIVLPPLRNPLFLLVGTLLGYLLPGSWQSGSRFGRLALIAGLVVAAIYVVLMVILLRT